MQVWGVPFIYSGEKNKKPILSRMSDDHVCIHVFVCLLLYFSYIMMVT